MQTLKNRLNKSRKENKGFTLVELIVVVVILAIIIGVAITGIYKYVNKARINTDINNASAIQSALAVLATEKDVIAEKGKKYEQTWTTANETIANKATADAYTVDVAGKISAILSDGLPEAKAGGAFKLTVETDDTGNVVVKCKGYTSDSVNEDGTLKTGDQLKELTAED